MSSDNTKKTPMGTENEHFITTQTIPTVENKIELTDISFIEAGDPKPKTLIVPSYGLSSPSYYLMRKDVTPTEVNDASIFTPTDSKFPKPVFNCDSWDQVAIFRKSSFLPKETDTISNSTHPKLIKLNQGGTENHIRHFISHQIPQSFPTGSDEIDSDFSAQTPSESSQTSSDIDPSQSQSQSETNKASNITSNEPGLLPDPMAKQNPWRHRKSVSMPQKVQNSLITHKLLPAKSNETADFSFQENTPQPPRKLHSFKRSWFRSSLSLKFRNSDVMKQASSQALTIINDKAHIMSSYSIKSTQQTPKNYVPRLLRILKKHAFAGDLSNGGTQLFNFVSKLKKKKKRRLNKLKKLFIAARSKYLLCWNYMKENIRRLIRPFRPDTSFIFCWNISIVVFIIISLILVPFRLSFHDGSLSDRHPLDTFLSFLNLFFIIDILVNFHTAFYSDGYLVFKSREIALTYTKSWFLLDLITSFPYAWLGNFIGDFATDSRGGIQNPFENPKQIFQFVSLIQILRVIKMKFILTKIEGSNDLKPLFNGILSLVKLFLLVFFIAHWCACGWHFLALDIEEHDWLSMTGLSNASIKDRYIASLYFCLTALLTVGFGDISPQNSTERSYAIFVMILGGCVFGYVMNSIAVILYSLEDEKAKIKNKITLFTRYMQKEGLAKDVQNDIKKYLEFVFEGRNTMKASDKEMLDTLSQDLKNRFYEQMNGKLLYGNKLLGESFTKRLLYNISSKIEERTYVPGESVFDIQDSECCLYFISKGSINFTLPKGGPPVLSLNKGNLFGEKSFFTGMERTLKAQSVDFSRLLFIKRNKFIESLHEFPHDKETFCMIKDKVLLYNEFGVLHLKCAVCNETSHILETCPKLRFIPDVPRIIKMALAQEEGFLLGFIRKDRNRFSARAKVGQLAIEAEKIALKYPSDLDEIKITLQDLDCSDKEDDSFKGRKLDSDKGNFYSNGKSDPHTLGHFRGISLDKPGSMSSKSVWIIYQRKLDELRALRETLGEEELRSRVKDEKILSSCLIEEEFVFEQVKNYSLYFPHNNVNKIIDKMEKKTKQGTLTPIEEIKKLKIHLNKFFKALDKQRAKSLLTRGNSRNSVVIGTPKNRTTFFRTFTPKSD